MDERLILKTMLASVSPRTGARIELVKIGSNKHGLQEDIKILYHYTTALLETLLMPLELCFTFTRVVPNCGTLSYCVLLFL